MKRIYSNFKGNVTDSTDLKLVECAFESFEGQPAGDFGWFDFLNTVGGFHIVSLGTNGVLVHYSAQAPDCSC